MNPSHPYTQLLRESIPEADPNRRWTGTISLAELEHEEYLRKGCKFAGRCPVVMEICKGVMPQDVHVGDALVKCHKYTEESPLPPLSRGVKARFPPWQGGPGGIRSKKDRR